MKWRTRFWRKIRGWITSILNLKAVEIDELWIEEWLKDRKE